MAGGVTRWVAAGVALGALLTLSDCNKPPAPVATNSPPANVAAASANTAGAVAPTAGAVDGPDAADAKAFLDGLYAHYKTNATGSTWAPFDANQRGVLDDDTRALMKADEKALNGDLGEIDGDWLCDCQDWQSITATITILSATPTTATARSEFHDTMDTGAAPKHDTFDLVKTAAGWRIHDMGASDQASLRKVLSNEIASLKKQGAHKPNPDEAP